MSRQPTFDHTTRTDYGSLTAVLADAIRVQADLLQMVEDKDALFVDTDSIRFLARRAQQLISAAHAEATRRP